MSLSSKNKLKHKTYEAYPHSMVEGAGGLLDLEEISAWSNYRSDLVRSLPVRLQIAKSRLSSHGFKFP